MNQPSEPQTTSPHRFFHTMVVVGGGLAATHCGGSAVALPEQEGETDPHQPGDHTEGTGGDGTGGDLGVDLRHGGTGGAFMGPDEIVPFPERFPITPVDSISMGGAALPEESCELAQMDCSTAHAWCEWSSEANGVGVEWADCICDPSRPIDESDCGTEEYLSCTLGHLDLDGDGLFELMAPIHCSCVPNSEEPEGLSANGSILNHWRHSERTILSGCEYIVLR